jgi:hypothetical protein
MMASPQPHGAPTLVDTAGINDQSYLSGSEDPLAYQSTPTKYNGGGGMSKTNGFGNPYSLSPQQQ